MLVKVLTPASIARKDIEDPGRSSRSSSWSLSVAAQLRSASRPIGIVSLATATAVGGWLNCLSLYVILHRRGHFRIEPLARQPGRSAADRRRRAWPRPCSRIERLLRRLFRGLGRASRCSALLALVGAGGIGLFPARLAASAGSTRTTFALCLRRKKVEQ